MGESAAEIKPKTVADKAKLMMLTGALHDLVENMEFSKLRHDIEMIAIKMEEVLIKKNFEA